MDMQGKLQARVSVCGSVYRNLLGIWAVLLLAACSGIPAGELTGPKKTFVSPDAIAADEAVMVFFRDDDDRSVGIPGIWVNDRLVGALQPGRYVQTSQCAGDARVFMLMRGQSEPLQDGVIRLSAGRVMYAHVHREGDGFVWRDLDEDSALRRLSQVKRQSHIVNRGRADCGVAVPLVASEPTQQRVLSADALFRFDGSALTDLLPSGRTALAALVRDIRDAQHPVQRLRVVGHADRLGDESYNDRLAEARASTVAAYLRQQGLTMPMEVIGRGSREPASRDCKGRPGPELIACLQPDRRVSIAWWDLPEATSP